MVKYIDAETNPLTTVKRPGVQPIIGGMAVGLNVTPGWSVYQFIGQPMLGGPVNGYTFIRNDRFWVNAEEGKKYVADPSWYIDWDQRRKDIKRESTDIGEIALKRWMTAPTKARIPTK